jgi:hypothetical protein
MHCGNKLSIVYLIYASAPLILIASGKSRILSVIYGMVFEDVIPFLSFT